CSHSSSPQGAVSTKTSAAEITERTRKLMIHAEDKKSVQNVEAMDISAQDTPQNLPEAPGDVYLFPASLEQHRYWILDQVDQASTASNMAIAWRMLGEVKDGLVEQSICALTLRHEALRTTFQMIDGDLNQVISE